jgi:glyoxylase-like metal-dependent hydrolase (beta-lactamase superfamily II)
MMVEAHAQTPEISERPSSGHIACRMIDKLNDVLALLPAETQLLPGHGRATTLARVKEVNSFLKSGR